MPTDPPPAESRARIAGRAAFGSDWQPSRRAVAPGRIELLGNHLDYNSGPVLAGAIDRAVVVLAADASAGGDPLQVVAADVTAGDRQPWAVRSDELRDWRVEGRGTGPIDYICGVVASILARPRLTIRSGAVAFAGDVPIGFGVSSSAALCIALALALTKETLSAKDLVLLAQEAEHRAGAPVGTMDQSASVAGGIIRFDSATLDVERLTPDLGDLVFAVADSGVDRSLGASSYPKRVEESRRVLDIAREALAVDLPHLAALSVEQLARIADCLPNPFLARARHVVTETERVRRGVEAVGAGDWPTFGRLMIESGRSSATDYAISHPRVEELVADALAVDEVLGARMMGGGEGGSALVLLPRPRVAALDAALRASYYARYAMADRPDLIHVSAFAEGARVDRLPEGYGVRVRG